MPRAINTALAPELRRRSAASSAETYEHMDELIEYLDGFGNLIDDRPIGLARIELRGTTTVHSNCRGARPFEHLCKRCGVAILGIKTLTDLHGHGNMRRVHRCLDNLLGQIGRAPSPRPW